MTQGTTLYCGDNCNHVGPCRRPETQLVITHCPHGLDKRIYPRCYMCRPLEPFEMGMPPIPVTPGCTCAQYNPWFSVLPPPCPLHNPSMPTITTTHT